MQKPGTPDAGVAPYVLMEAVHYGTVIPWPAQADGSGPSLQRLAASSFADDPANWIASGFSPGAVNRLPLSATKLTMTPAGELWWATPLENYVLQGAECVGVPALWKDDLSPRVTNNGRVKTTISMTTSNRFYRLMSK